MHDDPVRDSRRTPSSGWKILCKRSRSTSIRRRYKAAHCAPRRDFLARYIQHGMLSTTVMYATWSGRPMRTEMGSSNGMSCSYCISACATTRTGLKRRWPTATRHGKRLLGQPTHFHRTPLNALDALGILLLRQSASSIDRGTEVIGVQRL